MNKNVRPLLAALCVVLGTAAILWLMGRPPLYKGGLIQLWGPVGPKQSQMIFDWYSASHIIHGFLFYAILHTIGRPKKPEQRLLLATIVESAWELVENSPVIINRYREATIALGYRGDSILNSVSDILLMIAGFLLAKRLPVWASVMIVLVLELVPLAIIRDNLTLNIWMLVAPNDAIRHWQAGA
ncbi:UPF0314 protein [Sphingomonas astaxanthinifaciens DSM 22298]|uniref:UPF0314 protein n=2 Tax=Sphingomonas TaxID=13687 RepID=A0ABQ5Z7A8_9SPHN|nr:UPF0314 protein [Sphingomonas astaxanthinifaciens DSM 22298]